MRLLLLLCLVGPASAQLSEAITWRHGHAEHINTATQEGIERVTEWPVAPCGHSGHEQRGLGPRPTDEQLEALRLEYRASPEYAAREAEIQESLEGIDDTTRELDTLVELLVSDGLIRPDRVPAKSRQRINKRRARRGLEAL